MNKDNDVIPPSPPVKLGKEKGRSKHRNSLNQKKRRRSILSLRSKNREQSNGNGNGNDDTSMSSSGELTHKNSTINDNNVNIYKGLVEIPIEEKQRTQNLLKEFDIFAQSKLIEQCNQFDLSQQQDVKNHFVPQTLSQSHGLISLRELVSSKNEHRAKQSTEMIQPILPIVSNVRDCSVDEENIQFSEWPLPNDCSKTLVNKSLDNQRENTPLNLNSPITVQSILNDFDDDISNESTVVQSPPPILIRRKQRKTYARTQIKIFKKLLCDDDDDSQKKPFDESDEHDQCVIPGTQCTQDLDIDLNSSRRIVENLTSLSTFFTQPQSYELDFNTDLSHTIPNFEMRFDEFVSNSDDFTNEQNQTISLDDVLNDGIIVTPNQTKEKSNHEHYTNTELLDLEDDLFHNIDTPKGLQRLKNVKENSLNISTPHSSANKCVDLFGMHSTPSTSKPTISCEQRVPKRLRFGPEADQIGNDVRFSSAASFQPTAGKLPGFTKAGGESITTSHVLLKQAAQKFADIDNEYQHILPSDNDIPQPKRPKHVENNTMQSTNLNCDFMRQNRLSSGKSTNTSETALSRARNLFDDMNFDDLRCNKPITEFNSPVAGPSNIKMMGNGFTTSRGQAIKISTNNLQKYGQMLNEIDRNVCEEFGVETEVAPIFNENVLVCKTPLAKLTNQSKAFATSTPNQNVTSGFKRALLPPITPINKDSHAKIEPNYSNWVNEIMNNEQEDELGNLIFESTQELVRNIDVETTSVKLNDTMTSDIQPINDSIIGDDVLYIAENVKYERQKALSEQQADCLKKPYPIRPTLGWLFVQKILKSMKLSELETPKKYRRDELQRFGVQTNVIDLNMNNALQFKFDMWNYYPLDVCRTNVDGIDLHDDIRLIMDENSRVGKKEITSAFLQCPSVDPKLIPDHWIENALKWILIKLASYERSFPMKFSGKYLTPENVLAQLKYRYEREIDKVQRSAIRRIVEKDDSAAKRLVLFVSRILQHGFTHSLELSDGWYSIRTSGLDVVLSKAISNGKITVGTKLIIQGAEIEGMEDGCSPLEMPSSVALKISANSTRRARWYTKLGYCKESWPFAVPLNSVHGSGGIITRTKAFVLRVYPLVYVVKEKTEDGQRTVFRSNKVEQRQGKKDSKKHFEIIEKFYSEASEQIEKEYESHRKKHTRSRQKLCDINDGEELWNFMEHSNDGITFEADLTSTQKKLLTDYQTKFYDEKHNKIEAIVKEKLGAFESPVKSTALQKIRLIDVTSPDPLKTAILSIWNVNDSHFSINENSFLDMRNVTANGMRGKDIQLSANSLATLREVNLMSSTVHEAYKRSLIQLNDIDPQCFRPHFNEFDTIGMVLKIDDIIPNQFQCVFIADAMHHILCIKFWGSIAQFAYDDIVQERKFIAINHLEWRTFNRFNQNGIPQAFVTEITTISESPKSLERATALKRLKEQFDQLDLDTYIDECLDKLTQNVQANKENTTLNIVEKSHESTSNQSLLSRTAPASSGAGKQVLGVQQKIDRLRNYGSPPPFRGSYIQNEKHNLTGSRKPFKNPTRKETND